MGILESLLILTIIIIVSAVLIALNMYKLDDLYFDSLFIGDSIYNQFDKKIIQYKKEIIKIKIIVYFTVIGISLALGFVAYNFNINRTEFKSGIITIGEGTYKDLSNNALKYYEEIPDYIKDYMIEEGWEIQILDENIEEISGYFSNNEKYASYSLDGLTNYGFKKVYIQNRVEVIKGDTFLHEIGHVCDYINNFKSETEEFKRIHEREVRTFRIHFLSDKCNNETSNEYFAEAFKFYMKDKEKLEKWCPMTYQFINNLM